jgi:putative ABC transport system permease protein
MSGVSALLVGIVGVANIMLITVKERTRELGIRKAMGATNANIISMVLTESVIITLVFGYLGILLGVGLTELFDYVLTKTGAQVGFINPSVGFTTIVMASVVMVVAGIVAGYMPARRAVSIKLVDALNGL